VQRSMPDQGQRRCAVKGSEGARSVSRAWPGICIDVAEDAVAVWGAGLGSPLILLSCIVVTEGGQVALCRT
jgi:hypothetical protein